MAKRKNTDQVQINVRMRENLRAKLEQSAKKNYESLNREIVDRLERSFDRQELLVDALTLSYGERLAGLLMLVGRAMEDAGRLGVMATTMDGSNWGKNSFAYIEAVRAATAVLGTFRPPDVEGMEPREWFKKQFPHIEHIHLHVATSLIAAVKGKARPDIRKWAATVRELLDSEEESE